MKKNEKNIFNFLYKDDNTILSELSIDDLGELIDLLNLYKIEYRKNLGLPKKIKFGFEIECEYASKKIIHKAINEKYEEKGWYYKPDKSLAEGTEVVSPPLIDNEENWEDLKNVCEIIHENSIAGENSGGHIHFDSGVLNYSKKNIIKLLKIWAAYENVIYRFGYGEFLNARVKINECANTIAQEVLDTGAFDKNAYNEYFMNGLISIFSTDRYQGLNLKNISFKNKNTYKNTIEMRYHNGTSNHIIMQNNANFDAKFIKYSVSDLFNEDTISRRMLINKDELSNLRRYEEIDLVEALELADLIFDNNLDKINFLKQYLKDMRETRIKTSLVPAKRLTKR